MTVDGTSARLFPLVHGLFWLLSNLTERRPMVLAVDDLHWCDEESLRFLLYVAQRTSALRAALEALEDGRTPEPERYLRAMQHDLTALTSLVDDVFLLSRIESGAIEPARAALDLTEIAGEAVEALAPTAAGAGVGIELRSVEPVPTRGNAVALGRVVRNLIDNAVAYGKEARLSVSKTGADVLVRVDDDGPGMSEEALASATRPFMRGDASRNRSTGGAGLGLTLADAIVKTHGGSLELTNRQPHGLSATIKVPLAPVPET